MHESEVADAIGGLIDEARQSRAVQEDMRMLLVKITEQNADILAQIDLSNRRQTNSERRIRAVEGMLEQHERWIQELQAATGCPAE